MCEECMGNMYSPNLSYSYSTMGFMVDNHTSVRAKPEDGEGVVINMATML